MAISDYFSFSTRGSEGRGEDDSYDDEPLPEEVHVQFGHERIKSLFEEATEKKIDVSPFYQRDYVWNKRIVRTSLPPSSTNGGMSPLSSCVSGMVSRAP
jgi:hypothetical protein